MRRTPSSSRVRRWPAARAASTATRRSGECILAKSITRSLDNQPTLPEHDAHVATLDRRRGAGGVGGYFGARLALAGAAVRFVARGAHLAAIRRDGLRVRSMTEGERVVKIDAVETLARGAPADAVLFCVKSY